MHMRTRDDSETIETQLRATAPILPPELRQQILRRCQNERRNVPVLTWYRRWRLTGAFASLVLFCWITSGRLDAQSQALINGEAGRQSINAFATRADNADFVTVFRWRIHQLALLLNDTHSG
ncbi:MAG: hypothetical protein JWL77_6372 [Chthonomonadaceae bacterium]|nr:hypothetical protein [Chthonomonadaceae bacterium]